MIMILVKTKASTLWSLGLFIILCLAGGIYGLINLLKDVHAPWYNYVLVVILLPLGLTLLIRMLLSYKNIRIGKGKVEVHYPVRGKKITFRVKDIESWKEESIKTPSGTYRELQIKYSGRKKLDISMQEHTSYKETVVYFQTKAASKKEKNN
ncbi:MAG: hypothetical protein P8X57_12055 [Cyclobacteriaceae bacterium]